VGVQEHATVDRDPEVTYIVNCVCEFGRQLIDVLRSLPVWLVAVVGIEICDHCDHFWLIHLICVLKVQVEHVQAAVQVDDRNPEGDAGEDAQDTTLQASTTTASSRASQGSMDSLAESSGRRDLDLQPGACEWEWERASPRHPTAVPAHSDIDAPVARTRRRRIRIPCP
jgi:hypothetical protein